MIPPATTPNTCIHGLPVCSANFKPEIERKNSLRRVLQDLEREALHKATRDCYFNLMTGPKALRPLLIMLRLGLGGIFIYAAWTKLRDPWSLFAMAIDSYQLLPLWAVEWTARVLPWLELALGALLVTGRSMRISTALASLLLVVFFALMVRAYLKGMEISCGCFGPGETLSWKTLLRDGSMLAGSLLLTAVSFRNRTARNVQYEFQRVEGQ